jgi:phage shock protein PspC (stress-responsive transcriptional regulator)
MDKKILRVLNWITVVLGAIAIGVLIYAILKNIFHF